MSTGLLEPTLPISEKLAQRFGCVAIVHEWLTIPGGSEKVVEALLELFPQAELFTTIYDPAPWPAIITERRVHTTLLNGIPGARRNYPRLLPLMTAALRRFDLSGFDLVISSNHACAKNVRVPAGTMHICYCHTPMRYAWDPSFIAGEDLGSAARLGMRALGPHLRAVDRRAAAGPDAIVANSHFVAQRIARNWGREDARVIHPPVDVERFLEVPRDAAPAAAPYLFFGRLVPYKRAEEAVAACERLGRPLLVAGEGRAMDAARAASGEHTRFLGRVEDEEVPALLAGARALLFPGVEDFGIVPVEAQAAGLPVIARNEGGVQDSVLDGETGVLYSGEGIEGLCEGILRFESETPSETQIRARAATFSKARFQDQFAALALELPQKGT